MRRVSPLRSLPMAILLLASASACRTDGYSYSSETLSDSERSVAALGPGESFPETIPQIVGPHEVAIDFRFDYQTFDSGQLVAQQRERLLADGQGELKLALEFMAGADGMARTPTAQQAEKFARRQFFHVLYRGPQLGDLALATRNYSWRLLDGSHTVAGRPVDRYRLVSLFSIGDVQLDVDQATNVVLAWTFFDAVGQPSTAVEAHSVDFQPDLQSVDWPTALVPTIEYDGLGEQGILGFNPLNQTGSGAGFLESELRVLPLESAGAGATNILLDLMSDGVRSVVIAQQETGVRVDEGLPFAARALSFTKLDEGGVTVMQGKLDTKEVFAVGSVPSSDLMVLVSTLQPN